MTLQNLNMNLVTVSDFHEKMEGLCSSSCGEFPCTEDGDSEGLMELIWIYSDEENPSEGASDDEFYDALWLSFYLMYFNIKWTFPSMTPLDNDYISM